MNNLLNPENRLFQLINKIVYSVYLNILWFVFSLPIVTIGAATTAVYEVSLKICNDEESYITLSFIRSFKRNFKQATLIWIIMILIGLLLGADGYILYRIWFTNAFWTIISSFYIFVLFCFILISIYIFPLLSKFDNTIVNMFKNSFFIGIRYLLVTVTIVTCKIAFLWFILNVFTPAIIFGFGFSALIDSYFLLPVFLQMNTTTDENPGLEK